MINRKNPDECIFCGSAQEITRDHIPPKSLFADPLPNDLLTVPACIKCNSNASLDDEYFRTIISLGDEYHELESIQRTWQKTWKGLNRTNYTGLRTSIVDSIRIRDYFTKSGIYLGKLPTYNIDMGRLSNTAQRVSMGLYYLQKGYSPFNRAKCSTVCVQSLNIEDSEVFENAYMISELLKTVNPITIGGDIFTAKIVFASDIPDFGLAVTQFYKKLTFITFFVDKEESAFFD